MSITEFLRARLDEDEAVARACNGPAWSSGDASVGEGGLYSVDDGWAIAWFKIGTSNEADDGTRQLPRFPILRHSAYENSVHAARHDPARALREVEAKRALLESWESGQGDWRSLHFLVAVYSDHPDYHPSWAVAG